MGRGFVVRAIKETLRSISWGSVGTSIAAEDATTDGKECGTIASGCRGQGFKPEERKNLHG